MRKNRDLKSGARYHVISRSNRREFTLEAPEVKELFIATIKRAKKKYFFHLENFCIMGNHFHLILKPLKGESLSAIMQWILGVFAMNYNKKYGLTGHFWGERFSSRIISGREDFISVFEYIDRNPVRANLVSNPWDWLYGSIAHARKCCWEILKKPSNSIFERFPYYKYQI